MSHVVNTVQRARKVHQCEVCPIPIAPGETYVRTITFDGTASTWKSHHLCSVATDLAWIDGYDDGGIIDADAVREWAEEYRHTDTVAAALVARLHQPKVSES